MGWRSGGVYSRTGGVEGSKRNPPGGDQAQMPPMTRRRRARILHWTPDATTRPSSPSALPPPSSFFKPSSYLNDGQQVPLHTLAGGVAAAPPLAPAAAHDLVNLQGGEALGSSQRSSGGAPSRHRDNQVNPTQRRPGLQPHRQVRSTHSSSRPGSCPVVCSPPAPTSSMNTMPSCSVAVMASLISCSGGNMRSASTSSSSGLASRTCDEKGGGRVKKVWGAKRGGRGGRFLSSPEKGNNRTGRRSTGAASTRWRPKRGEKEQHEQDVQERDVGAMGIGRTHAMGSPPGRTGGVGRNLYPIPSAGREDLLNVPYIRGTRQ